jgi:hypothetical protein
VYSCINHTKTSISSANSELGPPYTLAIVTCFAGSALGALGEPPDELLASVHKHITAADNNGTR